VAPEAEEILEAEEALCRLEAEPNSQLEVGLPLYEADEGVLLLLRRRRNLQLDRVGRGRDDMLEQCPNDLLRWKRT
jgi:hypothetical protein